MKLEIEFIEYHKDKLKGLCCKLEECNINFFDYGKVCDKIDGMVLPKFMKRVYHNALVCNNLYLEWFNGPREKIDFLGSLGVLSLDKFEEVHYCLQSVHKIIHNNN